MKYYIVLLVLLISISLLRAQTTCRAISFSGAGDRGAFEAGVVAALVANRPAEENYWQFATGISAGAINAASLSMFSIGDEKAASEYLINQWLNISKSLVYENWPGGVVEGLLLKQGLYSTEPLKNYLYENVDLERLTASNRSLIVGSTSLNTGLFNIFNKTYVNIVQSVYASAAVPGIFPPVSMDNNLWVDGGTTTMTIIQDTCGLCANTGADNIVIDAILGVGNPENEDSIPSSETTLPLLLRSGSIVTHNINMKDYQLAKQSFPTATINLYYPTQKLPGSFLDFDHSAIMLKYGYEDAVSEMNNQK